MKKVLIADDEKGVRFVIKCTLEKEGYEVIEADDGYEAINLIREEIPDLVILDIQMPLKDGFEVTKIMRGEKETENIPIFISTSADDVKSQFEGLNIQYFIPKPYNVDILIQKVKKFFESRK